MLRARPPRSVRARAVALASAARPRLIDPVRRHKKTLALAGTALALASAGSATAAPIDSSPPAPPARHVRLTADVWTKAARRKPERPEANSAAATGRASDSAQPQALSIALKAVQDTISWQIKPAAAPAAPPPFADQLMPVGLSGPQLWMPISGSQLANATTIVQQALAKGMGVRSAVIAVATAMQESQLQDLGYGSGGSLGLFQQQPSMGWGNAQQIMDPAYAADAFLTALQQYQAANPGWAAQPLWQSAQGVQKSGYPFAYARWETQAAGLVNQIATSPQR